MRGKYVQFHAPTPGDIDRHSTRGDRRGATLVLMVAGMLFLLASLAFAIDIGNIALSKGQLQVAVDAAALGAALEFDPNGNQAAVMTTVKQAAMDLAAGHKASTFDTVQLESGGDIEVGFVEWDPATQQFNINALAVSGPLNYVRVTGRLEAFNTVAGGEVAAVDQRIPLIWAPFFGPQKAQVRVRAAAAVLPGAGFRVTETTRAGLLPFTLDLPTWTNIENGIGQDNFTVDSETGAVSSGPDGIPEVNLYPEGTIDLPPGNRGTLDLGEGNNSTSDIERQILEGLNSSDLAAFGSELRTDNGPLLINGDTGISAGFKDELASIIGESRAIPIFSQSQNPGNNLVYTVVKFVGIRVVDVKLTGNNKRVFVQPDQFFDESVIYKTTTKVTIEPWSILTKPILIN